MILIAIASMLGGTALMILGSRRLAARNAGSRLPYSSWPPRTPWSVRGPIALGTGLAVFGATNINFVVDGYWFLGLVLLLPLVPLVVFARHNRRVGAGG
jgi:hypothetical protein